jgi:hypothetical protein
MKRPVLTVWPLAVLLAAIVLPGCGGKKAPTPADTYPAKIEVVDGVKTIMNPAFPRDGVVRYRLEEDLTVGAEGKEAGSVFNRPQSLDVDAQGNIYVLDWGDVDFKIFGPDGRFLRKFGKEGQGPGEFGIPAYFDLASDGRIFLLSGRTNQIIILGGDGTYLSSFRLDGFSPGLAVDRMNRVYYSRHLTPEMGVGAEYRLVQNTIALFRTGETGKDPVKLGEFPAESSMMKVQTIGGQTVTGGMTSREAYTTSWLVGPDDRVYLGYNKDYRLTVYDSDWKPVLRFGREFTPIRHPAYKTDGPHPEFYPAFSDWRKFFDDRGNLWLEQYVEGSIQGDRYAEPGVVDKVYDVFAPDGIYLRQVRVPEAIFLVRGDLAYSIVKTEDEFQVVKRFRMVREDKAPN